MAATVEVQEANGAGPTWSSLGTAKFCTDDAYNPGTDNPVPIVTGQTKRSYWKSHALLFYGTYTSVTNVKIYTDGGGFGTGIAVKISDETFADGGYDQATGTLGDTGDAMFGGGAPHTGVTGTVEVFTYSSASPKTVDSGTVTGSARAKHIVLQLETIDTASPGDLSAETFTWQYDEV